MTNHEDNVVIEIDPEIISKASNLFTDILLSNQTNLDFLSNSINASDIRMVDLSSVSSVVAGVSDPIAQLRDFLRSLIEWLWDKMSSAIADVLAKTIAKIGEIAPQIASQLSSAITTITRAISSGIAAISSSLATGIAEISSSITILSTSMVNLGASISTSISLLTTSISTQLLSLANSISSSFILLSSGLSLTIASLATSLSQSILSVSTSISQAILSLSSSISGSLLSLTASLSGAIINISSSLSFAINQLSGTISAQIVNLSRSIAIGMNIISSSLTKTILDVSLSISESILSLGLSLSQSISSIGLSLTSVIGSLSTVMIANFHLLFGRVNTAIEIMNNYYPKMISSLEQGFSTTIRALSEGFKVISSSITSSYAQAVRAIGNLMVDFGKQVNKLADMTIESITNSMVMLNQALIQNLKSMTDAITYSISRISDAISYIHRSLSNAIIESYQKASEAINQGLIKFSQALSESINKVIESINQGFRKTFDSIIQASDKLEQHIINTSKSMIDTILENLDRTMNKINESLLKWQNLIMQIGKTFEGFVNSILLLPERLEPTMQKHAQYTWDEYWVRYYAQTSPNMRKVYERVPEFFTGFSPSPWDMILNLFRNPVESITNSIAWIGTSITLSIDKVTPLLSGFINAFTTHVWKGFEAIGNFIFETTTKLGVQISGKILEISNSIINTIKETVDKARDIFLGLFKSLAWGTMESIEKITGGLLSPLITMVFPEELGRTLAEYESAKITKMISTSFFWSTGLMAIPLIIQIPLRFIAWQMRALGMFIGRLGPRLSAALKPIGIGLGSGFNPLAAIGSSLTTIANSYERAVNRIPDAFAYGIGIWASQPLSKLMNYFLRDIVPVSLPQEFFILEMLKRRMEYNPETLTPSDTFAKTLTTANTLLAMYGYPSFFVNWFTALMQNDYVEISDRFGTRRKLPRSLMHELPSLSEIVRMMIRDMFADLTDFYKTGQMRGMTWDAAVMYYLLHFRYPPPEKLWSYVTRGISGLLWARKYEEKAGEISSEARRLGAFEPVDSSDLNYKGAKLFEAFSKYMKWHDYARFSWIPNFTSDNQIYIDTLADIPTKIDQRWMVRFGLYELMAEKGITITNPVSDFVTKVVENTPSGQIILDLTNFCRTLQATGIHPYYVPIVSVAETINAITDERTLLRTGILNLFKEGFIDLTAVDKLLAGIIKTSFKISYYNTQTHNWNTGFINVPLRYLSMEAKLMEIRALQDRALDILKEAQRDLLTAYQEWIITSYDEFKSTFTNIINYINNVYAKDFREITKQELPSELALKYIDDYYLPYIKSLEVWRNVHVIRRIRYWSVRWIGWLMYRIANGVITPEETSQLVDYISTSSKLTTAEKEYIKNIMTFMRELSVREYVPTPSQLATLAEYVVIPDSLIENIFNIRQVPDYLKPIWSRYIRIRPIADDIRAVINAYRRALLYVTIPENIVAQVKNAMALIGFTEEEEKLFNLRVTLDELVINAKEYIPSPVQLASLAEYVSIPSELINKAFEKRKIPEEWKSIWTKYIQARVLADDVKLLISTCMRAIEYSKEATAFLSRVMEYASLIGLSSTEREIIELRAQLEELIYKARAYIPTPITLATICEILPDARYYFDNMATALRISSEWLPLWAKYIDLKPLINDINKMLSRAEDLYCSFMITEENFLEILNSVKNTLGYTEKEIEFLLYTYKLRRYQLSWKEIIGDVDRMMTLCEYSPKAREFALGILHKMIDSLPTDDETKNSLKQIWEDYIRIKPVKDEVTKYITDLINAFIDGIISQQIFEEELEALKEWGLDDYEVQFYKAIATLRKARKLKMTLY